MKVTGAFDLVLFVTLSHGNAYLITEIYFPKH